MHVAGFAMAVVGVGLAVRSLLLLLGRGRPLRGPRPAMVVAGPYRRVRNPLAAGLLIMLAGVALASESWLLVIATLGVAVGSHAWIVRIEEPRLRTRFGPPYEAYLQRVPRWLPRLGASEDKL